MRLKRKRYNHWTVLGLAYNKDRRNFYHIQCDCGYKTIKESTHLGQSKWCRKCEGKINSERKSKPSGANSSKSILTAYKKGAKSRNYSWELTDEEAYKLLQGKCRYCGREPFRFYRATRANGGIYVNGIDRIDNTKGYTKENSDSCCSDCNKAKSQLSELEFFEIIKLIYKNKFGGDSN